MQSKLKQPNLNRSLAHLEVRLRPLLPAQLYVDLWADPSLQNLNRVFNHLRTLLYILGDHIPVPVKRNPPTPGQIRYQWHTGTLLFTDLAGFTPFMEAHAIQGKAGANRLLTILNQYFAAMVEIISKSGGELLEFTGDAILAQFLVKDQGAKDQRAELGQAVRAGLRMQRAMAPFQQVEAGQGTFNLKMRIGIHQGRFLATDVGTPLRMGRVLLGQTVQEAKQTEGAGLVDRVCLSPSAVAGLDQTDGKDRLHLEVHGAYYLVVDDLSQDALGEYEIGVKPRSAAPMLFERTPEALMEAIETLVNQIEPLASYQAQPALQLLTKHAADRQIPPHFPTAIILFVNLLSLAEGIDQTAPYEQKKWVQALSQLFASINATVASQGGVLQRMTYHPNGSDLLIHFGVINAHSDDAIRAAITALKVRELIRELPPLPLDNRTIQLACQIGMARGQIFAAEIGETRGRREYNVLGDVANIAARLMTYAQSDQILMTAVVEQALRAERSLSFHPPQFVHTCLGAVTLKGKSQSPVVFSLDFGEQIHD
jgi:class 3 adenylate cyclase